VARGRNVDGAARAVTPMRAARLIAMALALCAVVPGLAAAQTEPGHGERVDVTQAVWPAQVVADRVFYDLQVTVVNREAEEHPILLFSTLYLGSGPPCEGQRADQAVSKFQKSVTLGPHASVTVDAKADHWGQEVDGSHLPADGTYEVCVWARLATCPTGQPLAACFLDDEPGRLAVRLRNAAPEVRIQAPTLRGSLDATFAFAASADDADGDSVTLAWDFGDLSPGSTAAHVTHRFGVPGRYDVTVVADDGWDRTQASVTVQVDPAGAAPPPPPRVPGAGPLAGILSVAAAALLTRRRRA